MWFQKGQLLCINCNRPIGDIPFAEGGLSPGQRGWDGKMANRTKCCLDASSPWRKWPCGYRHASLSVPVLMIIPVCRGHTKWWWWQFSLMMVLSSQTWCEFVQIHTHALVILSKTSTKSDGLRVVHFVSGLNAGCNWPTREISPCL